jgi:hypothetical protein
MPNACTGGRIATMIRSASLANTWMKEIQAGKIYVEDRSVLQMQYTMHLTTENDQEKYYNGLLSCIIRSSRKILVSVVVSPSSKLSTVLEYCRSIIN